MTPTATITVLRPFLFNGAPTAPGDVLTTSAAFAAEMVSAGKAARYTGPTPPPAVAVQAPPVYDLAPATAPATTRNRKGKS